MKHAADLRQRLVLGLLASELQVRRATLEVSRDGLDKAVFRLGQHYKTLAMTRRHDASERACAAIAARQLLEALIRPPKEALRELEDAERFLSGIPVAWQRTAGFAVENFETDLALVRSALQGSTARHRAEESDQLAELAAQVVTPGWIQITSGSGGDELLISQGPWEPSDHAELRSSNDQLAEGVAAALISRNFDLADRASQVLVARLGKTWAPTRSV